MNSDDLMKLSQQNIKDLIEEGYTFVSINGVLEKVTTEDIIIDEKEIIKFEEHVRQQNKH